MGISGHRPAHTACPLLWLFTANWIYQITLAPEPPVSIDMFIRDVFTTTAGRRMIIVGLRNGVLFAFLVLAISVASFPLLLDRDVGLDVAVWTSISVVAANPGPMLLWGLIVAGSLLIGSIPAFLGLVFTPDMAEDMRQMLDDMDIDDDDIHSEDFTGYT